MLINQSRRLRKGYGKFYRSTTTNPFRRAKGSLSEFGAAIALVLPIGIICLFLACEVAELYMINSALNCAAAQAARSLAIGYGQDPSGAVANPSQYFAKVKFLNLVQNTAQFSIPSGAAGWNTTANPPTVTVQVTFCSGKNGCPVLPNPDPLMLSSNLQMTTSATSWLE